MLYNRLKFTVAFPKSGDCEVFVDARKNRYKFFYKMRDVCEEMISGKSEASRKQAARIIYTAFRNLREFGNRRMYYGLKHLL